MKKKNIFLVTGGCGFIGANFIEMLLDKGETVINIDSFSYAANKELNRKFKNYKNYKFYKGSYGNTNLVKKYLISIKLIKLLILQLRTHVDNSIYGPIKFLKIMFMIFFIPRRMFKVS